MKKFVWILLGVLTLWGCKPESNPSGGEGTSEFAVSPASLSFKEADNSTKFVSITAGGAWTATVTGDWIHTGKLSGTGNGSISVKVDANEEDNARSGKITVSYGTKSASVDVSQEGSGKTALVPAPAAYDATNKLASTTYQLLVYSFADSNGDGVGDFKGIQNKLDYLNDLGITALWLSPIHPCDSYHGYDVTDYFTVNPDFGTEADFQNLLKAAHDKGIKIYIDYVLNHSGKGNPWFQEALADPNSPYRDYYFFSSNPASDYGKFPMLKNTVYQSDDWKQVTTGSPKLTISSTTEALTDGTETWNLYMWQDNAGDKSIQFVKKSEGNYYLVTEINGQWGLLVRKYGNWNPGSKFGAKGGNKTVQLGTPVDLVADGADMSFTGNGRYKIELTDVSTETLFYMGCFSDWMPDLNYGDVSVAENNDTFKDLAASADKWIQMGVDGLRLDAVKHICGGINSYNNTSNHTLLGKWYEHCNTTYKAAGHIDNIFMVAEAWDEHSVEKQYYKALTSCFEFDYGYKVRDILNSGSASGFASAVAKYISDHTSVRPDAVTSFFLSNHDQDRFGSNVGKKMARMKQAGAILLSGGGKPFIYQGEELGYYGTKGSGDEFVRTPMMWDKAGKDCAKKGVNNKVDNNMLKADISVEAQEASQESILNVYKTWNRLRNTYPALAEGQMTKASLSGSSIAAWYMTAGSQKLLVIHNVADSETGVSVSDSMDKPIAVLGTAYTKASKLLLGPNSSVVFEL